ncbi:MAG: type II toxin-antitoxin system VapC family toxin [Candidatus Hydrothermarchaeaceae archaeon]
MRFFIDTSIFVDTLRLDVVPASKSLFECLDGENEGFTSTIAVAELSVGAYLSSESNALEKTVDLLSLVSIIDLDREIAMEAGKIYSGLVKKGSRIELNDCLIAATCLSLGVSDVVTRNTNHFERIGGINAITPEELEFKV